MHWKIPSVKLVIAFSACFVPGPASSQSMHMVVDNGGRLDWLNANPSRIAYDAVGPNGLYQLFTMNPDGSDSRCLSCSATALPQGNRGNPAWHPSGQYIVFQAEHPNPLTGFEKFHADPGQGVFNDLWISDAKGQHYWQITTSQPRGGGVLHPHFSPDGKKLLWAERLGNGGGHRAGIWALKVADFNVDNGRPRLGSIRSYQPLGETAVYESHGFAADNQTIIFTGSKPPATWGDTNIYTFNLGTKQLAALTNGKDEWNEHAHFSHDGRFIIYASSVGNVVQRDAQAGVKGTGNNLDLWMMLADGTGKQRLTNIHDPKSPAYQGEGAAADGDWSPDDSQYMFYIIRPTRRLSAQAPVSGQIWVMTAPKP